MRQQNRHEAAIRDRLTEIGEKIKKLGLQLEHLENEEIALEAVLKAAEGKEDDG